MPGRHTFIDYKDGTIQKLREDLWMLRYRLLNLLPPDIHQILKSYRDCSTRKETYQWLDRVAEEIVGHAKPMNSPMSWGGRANCPLCGRGADSPYEEGFSLPEGLRRHLIGFGNVHQCLFTEVAAYLARDHWQKEFAVAERIEQQVMSLELARRRQVELLYRTSPFDDDLLLDECIWFGERSRNDDELTWAESRLTSLGLRKHIEGNVCAWVDDRDDWVVYADIRIFGRIVFSVWKKPLPKHKPANAHKYNMKKFCLYDTWKHDLKAKYEVRLSNP